MPVALAPNTVTDGALLPATTVVMPSLVTLPTATIQDDFTTVLSEVHAGIIPSEDIWLSCYKDGEPSIHGKISVSLHEQDRDRVELVGRGGVELTRASQVSLFFSGMERFIFIRIRLSIRLLIRRRSFRSSADFEPGTAGPLLISTGTQPTVQDSGSILFSFLRGRFMRILHIRTKNV
jgi:hypothetical protein